MIESLGQNVDRWVTFESIGQEIIYGYGDKNYPPSRFDYPQSTSHIFTAAGNIMKTHKFIYEKFKNAGIENVGIGIEGLEYSQPADNENQKGIGLNNRNSNFSGLRLNQNEILMHLRGIMILILVCSWSHC